LLSALFALSATAAGCSSEQGETGPAASTVITDISLSAVEPGILLPGSQIALSGASFVPELAGDSQLRLSGSMGGSSVSLSLPALFVDYDQMVVDWPGGLAAGLPADDGLLVADAVVEAHHAYDGLRHRSPALPVELEVHYHALPSLAEVQNSVTFVNDPVLCVGNGFLLGGDEGQTVAVVEGCFTPEGEQECTAVGPTEVVTQPFQPFDRTRVTFPFSPHIAGIEPGSFEGTVWLENRHGSLAGSAVFSSGTLSTANSLVEPAIHSIEPTAASLGQYVDIAGGGFIGVLPGGSDPLSPLTLIELDGTFTPEGSGVGDAVALDLVPEFVSGQLVRYVLNETDELGQSVDLRQTAGTFEGTVRPVVQFDQDTTPGSATTVTLGIAHVKQVVWLRFMPSYVEALRHFGLRAVDPHIRARVIDECREVYGGLNVEFREAAPTDFALYSEVELSGADPNGYGLLGYDNTPGKDDGNLRLHDKIGGVNALTQEDGYPGYGGVFVDSLFAFSMHPGSFATKVDGADAAFDELFDPFRPDVGGSSVSAAEAASAPVLDSGEGCPASGDRSRQIGCAVWALGSMIGTITAHEIGHSLGLADPGGFNFHNGSDLPNALMDSGYNRSFRERARIHGEGPGRFCRQNYEYLRDILPTDLPDPHPDRPDCF